MENTEPTLEKKAWEDKFLATLRETANVRLACKSAKVKARSTAYDWKRTCPRFAALWEDALQEACDTLEEEAWKRAKEQSDTLLIFMLKAHRPEKYREKHEQNHTGQIKIVVAYDDPHPDPAESP